MPAYPAMILISEDDGGTFIGLDTCTGAQLAAAEAEARRKRAETYETQVIRTHKDFERLGGKDTDSVGAVLSGKARGP